MNSMNDQNSPPPPGTRATPAEPAWPAGLPKPAPEPLPDQLPGFRPAERPEDYALPLHADDDVAGNIAADSEARALLHAAELPAAIGSALAQRLGQIPDLDGGADDAAFFGRWEAARERLAGMWGSETFEARMTDLRALVAHVDRATKGGATQFLDRYPGVLTDQLALSQLLLHAGRWAQSRAERR